MPDYSRLGVNDLLRNADDAVGSPDSIHALRIAEIKMQQAQAELTGHALVLNGKQVDDIQAACTIAQRQADLSTRANELTEKLLLSNELAGKQSEKTAEAMYKATQQLAKSTRSLNWATWVLVTFTAVQSLIAFVALYRK